MARMFSTSTSGAKSCRRKRSAERSIVHVGRLPTFVLGLNEAVALWRMSVKFEKDRVPSIFGQEHFNSLLMKNTFKQGVYGKATLFVPDLLHMQANESLRPSEQWNIAIPEEGFHGAAGQPITVPMEVVLELAAMGVQPIRIDFEVEADRADKAYKFSVWRTIEVGLGDVHINLSTELDERNRLVVKQEMSNHSGSPMSFKCFLYAHKQRRKRSQVFELGPEIATKTYTYSAGRELLGHEITLRVEELDGPRVLIKRYLPEANPAAK